MMRNCTTIIIWIVFALAVSAAPKIPPDIARELRLLERDACNAKVSMAELEPRLEDLLADASTPTERGAVLKLWGDGLRVRKHWSNALSYYERATAEDPARFGDAKKSPVPYYADMCRIERLPGRVQTWAIIVLILAAATCLASMGRLRPDKRDLALLAAWLAAGVGSGYILMLIADFCKTPLYPEGSKETGGHYVFVIMGAFINPFFWSFVAWTLPLLVAIWLMAINRRPNRCVRVVAPALLVAQIFAGAVFWRHAFHIIPNIYRADATPFLRPMHLGLIGERGAMIVFALLTVAAVAATAWALRKRAAWLHIPASTFSVVLAATAIVALFLNAHRTDLVGSTPKACYFKTSEIENYVRSHPDFFVNLSASDAETEELKQFILTNTRTVPPEDYAKERRDDVREEPKK